jgi:hypothetical protein
MADVVANSAMTEIPEGRQWLRKVQLIIAKRGSPASLVADGLDISDLHFRFQVTSADIETPNLLTVRVYNLDPDTIQSIVKEYDQVSLQAGYVHANFSLIFTGTIRQFKRGRENAVDSFLEILAADNDLGYNFGFVNTTLSPDQQAATWQDVYTHCAQAMNAQVDPQTVEMLQREAGTQGNIFLPRGRVLYGMGRTLMRHLVDSIDATWSVQNGVMIVTKNTGVRGGAAVVLGPETGLIGVPEATDSGVEARCLLNPSIKIGVQVSIASNLINEATQLNRFRPTLAPTAALANNSLYRVLAIEHVGDTRGQEWYTDLIGLALDPSLIVSGGSQ